MHFGGKPPLCALGIQKTKSTSSSTRIGSTNQLRNTKHYGNKLLKSAWNRYGILRELDIVETIKMSSRWVDHVMRIKRRVSLAIRYRITILNKPVRRRRRRSKLIQIDDVKEGLRRITVRGW